MDFGKYKKLVLALAAILGLPLMFLLFSSSWEKTKTVKFNPVAAEKIKSQEREIKTAEKNNEKKEEGSAKIFFLGDLMLDREIRVAMDKKGTGFITEKIANLFRGNDANIANLEGTITERKSVSVGTTEKDKGHFYFTFDPGRTAEFLKNNKIGIVSLGNNHVLNFGENGLEETKNNLKNSGVEYFGDPRDENNFLIKEINGRIIGLVNYNQFSNIGVEEAVNKIKEIRSQSDYVIVYAHWGVEYQLAENKSQQEKAHAFIDAGADLVVGTHPHVVEPLEIYKNKAIFYSLGNFVFDQYFSEDTKIGMAINVSFAEKQTEVALIPLYIEKNGQVTLLEVPKRNKLLERLAENSQVDEVVKNDIISGRFEIQN